MGVIYVVAEAMKRGFTNGHPDWSNLGQGQPEVGELRGAPPRVSSVEILPEDHAYGPVEGTPELRERIAAQYTAANVCVAAGGRLSLTRALVGLGSVHVGYQLPDYTAYEDMLGLHLDRITAIPLRTREEHGFQVTLDQLSKAIDELGLEAFLISNPCNPTGNVVVGEELACWVDLARRRGVTLLLDEFYSHFVYTPDGEPGAGPISGAPYIEDVEDDPVLLIDGLTKSYRYPGWRVGWIVGPTAMIETIKCAASSVDGGPSRIVQRAAMEVLEPRRADQETAALRDAFAIKRNLMIERLEDIGVRFARKPTSTFYCWGCLDRLEPPFHDAWQFFWRAMGHQVMTVPGEFFDVNPGKRRHHASPYQQWMRFSFGPPRANLEMGLDRLAKMVREGR
jgi:hypothetical protein